MRRAIVAALLGLAACTVAGVKIGNPVTQLVDKGNELTGNKKCTLQELERFQLTAENEYWFGRSVADRIVGRYTPDKVYEPDSPAAVYLNEVGQAVVVGALAERDEGGFRGPARKHPLMTLEDDVPDRPMPLHGYRFLLVHDAAPGAWGLPGGYVVVTDGMLSRLKSEDELAGVLAHEVAHVQRGHGTVMVENVMCTDRGTIWSQSAEVAKRETQSVKLANSVLPMDKVLDFVSKGADLVTDATVKGQPARPKEYEADAYGVRYLAAAGYSPGALADFLNRIDKDPAFAQNAGHVEPHLRAKDLEKQITAENLTGHTPDEAVRTARFQSAVQGKLRTAALEQAPSHGG